MELVLSPNELLHHDPRIRLTNKTESLQRPRPLQKERLVRQSANVPNHLQAAH
ncbi:uncharacterized protein MELLADRAFT_55292 [Melampsora larici-populina 98AG31]|uniref:Uncharacterized protein n=1 Tax=Melampsora larici-populina (strain 98AG31 / pathotype 3-4-7) TaxID=747676 RepID=F4RD30_MELLP|nr:uncharacterized protein MELLADRAFT_55292 [Melampsora larici-populina 98AG31]EGG09885.1 hypothetical protein MELLADRAFT_55292 [Melampsora larici-populina 98AG31]